MCKLKLIAISYIFIFLVKQIPYCWWLFRIIILFSTRVSNALGAGSPQAARVSSFCSMVLMLCVALIVSSTVFASQNILGHVFSNEPDVIQYVTNITPVIVMSVFVSSLQGTLTGKLFHSNSIDEKV